MVRTCEGRHTPSCKLITSYVCIMFIIQLSTGLVKAKSFQYCQVIQVNRLTFVTDVLILNVFMYMFVNESHNNMHDFCSQLRYWLLLFVTLVLNILFIVYFNPGPGEVLLCPQIYSFGNGTLNQDLDDDYIIATLFMGSLFAFLSVWMVLEYFVVTWPHFVFPKILYSIRDKIGKYFKTK